MGAHGVGGERAPPPSHGGDTIPAAALDTFVFHPKSPRFSAVGLESVTRSAAISLSSTGGQTDIALQLTIDLHNLRAGGVLDPEGVGAEVYAREMRPEAALANRRAAVATHPEHPRCQLQLSRALQAVSDFDGARNALVAAARAGKSALPSAARSLRSRYKPSAKA